jgi:predicted metal-binding protein
MVSDEQRGKWPAADAGSFSCRGAAASLACPGRSVAEQVAKLSEALKLKAADIIYSGSCELADHRGMFGVLT